MEKEEKNTTSKKKLVIIDSKNKNKGVGKNKGVTLTVKAKDIPEGVNKDDLVVAFEVNAKEEKSKDKKTKFKAKYLIPVVLPLLLIGAVKGCQSDNPTPVQTPQKLIEQVDIQHYDIDSPYVFMEGTTNAKGQEGMTAKNLSDENDSSDKYYDEDKQFKDEERASSGQETFEHMETELDESMNILKDPQATPKQKAEAAKKALEIDMQIEQIYKDNLEFIESNAESFEESSKEFEDSNTEAEIKVIRETVDEYKENLGLTTENVTNMAQIVSLINEGYDIDVDMLENTRGDYTISGEAVKVIAEEVGLEKEAEDTYNKFINTKEQVKETNDIGGINDGR